MWPLRGVCASVSQVADCEMWSSPWRRSCRRCRTSSPATAWVLVSEARASMPAYGASGLCDAGITAEPSRWSVTLKRRIDLPNISEREASAASACVAAVLSRCICA